MEETKFRGKCEGNWMYGSYAKTGVGLHYIVPQNLISNQLLGYVVDKKSVGQYTGLKDKHSKEIFEGDSDGFYIVKKGEFPVRCHETCKIIDRAYGWYLDPIDKSTEPSSWEIPLNDFYVNRLDAFDKNIYDNPELLEN
ncbi:YopX family protein [Bacillus thuringiensis]|uniref:YopX protein domain-containing protein n=1 Tax=Bacillus thuringiensis subsp. tolworthi TaxID=1442 RepID=A0A9W4EWX9_BACTO|nr:MULTISPECIES: YopX family protein [Bacillus cereus group]MEB8712260.1 YopX family protein [Bacillus cereus]KIP23477.1 yopX family protein [Bacillus thuringiensis serovar morrisoni]MEB9434632.1 YopX family protein [Bacillus cereus]MEB9483439.1 YopX family protein [Bacillus cereus]MEB9591342.1 YopX family protein [Bacillus cereus]